MGPRSVAEYGWSQINQFFPADFGGVHRACARTLGEVLYEFLTQVTRRRLINKKEDKPLFLRGPVFFNPG